MIDEQRSTLAARLEAAHWDNVTLNLHQNGYAVIDDVLDRDECLHQIESYTAQDTYRKTVVMERYRFGSGEYKYFKYPLPPLVAELRETVYPHLATVANKWMDILGVDTRYPLTHTGLLDICHAAGQTQPTPLILKYGQGGFNTLHRDLYGAIFFPLQLVVFLNKAEEDYCGGEFVLTEQVPRAQSKAIVLRPKQGSMLIFTTNFRPVKGSRGFYRAGMRHGVSPILSGERHTLGIIFHDAQS